MVLKLADDVKVVFKEQPKYSRSGLLANIGGTAGLVLGLSVLSILQCVERVFLFMIRRASGIKTKLTTEEYRNGNTNETMMKYM